MEINNIVLIGMPNSGKSSVGKCLADILKMQLIDTDLLILQKKNKKLVDIVNEDGLETFLLIQQDIILDLNLNNCIIATGGSVIYNDISMKHLKKNSIIIYLVLSLDELENRKQENRNFAKNNHKSFLDIYYERIPLYEGYADIFISCDKKGIDYIANEIISKLEIYTD